MVSLQKKLEDVSVKLKAHLTECAPCRKEQAKTLRAAETCKEGRQLSDRVDELLVYILLP